MKVFFQCNKNNNNPIKVLSLLVIVIVIVTYNIRPKSLQIFKHYESETQRKNMLLINFLHCDEMTDHPTVQP